MGAILVVPLVFAVLVFTCWLFWAARRTRQAHAADQTLPQEPYARREEELSRLRRQHLAEEPDLATLPPHRRR